MFPFVLPDTLDGTAVALQHQDPHRDQGQDQDWNKYIQELGSESGLGAKSGSESES